MTPQPDLPYTVFQRMTDDHVPLLACAEFGEGLAAARWLRDEVIEMRYCAPNHHTLSLYVAGGSEICRVHARGEHPSFGAGSLCVMPLGQTTDWRVAGSVEIFHLYIPRKLFEWTAAADFDRDPSRVELPERAYFLDPELERLVRGAFLHQAWSEPADRLALNQASHLVVADVLRKYSTIGSKAAMPRGGLAPHVRRKVRDRVEASLDRALVLSDLAEVAGLSPFHFARAFKQSFGEAPHAFVLRQRIARARELLTERELPMPAIAAACGFSSQSHFTATFRKLTGVTPRRYSDAMCADFRERDRAARPVENGAAQTVQLPSHQAVFQAS